ncbi:MAG: endonuclease/exonuclease/phosphatase family protein [Bacteroidia bacterium]
MRKHIALVTGIILSLSLSAQKLNKSKNYYITAIGFWNVENLFDTINDLSKNDEEYTPGGANAWNGKRYWTKIDHLAKVISEMGSTSTPDGLSILGMCEIENKNVVEDLVNHSLLKKRNYQIVHIEGPDARGVDPSFIYNPSYFKVTKAVSYPVTLVTDSSYKTRDILVVTGLFGGEPMAVLVNHWPSRRGGENASMPNRNAAAKVARHVADSIINLNPETKVLIMGDLNDDPINESVKKHIGTYAEMSEVTDGAYFNPMENLHAKGVGTLAWRDNWNLFDQIMLSNQLVKGHYKTWNYYSVRIFNKPYLKSDFGNFKGYPLRTYAGGKYMGGYSDHFPVYILLAKEAEAETD